MNNLIQWKPFGEIDRFFEDRLLQGFPKLGFDLAVDVFEEKGNVIAKMNLPGITQEELDVMVEDDVLTITGRREEEKEVDKKNYYSKEIKRGSFSRSVALPRVVDGSKASAEYKDGFLVVTMPTRAGSKERGFKVQVKNTA